MAHSILPKIEWKTHEKRYSRWHSKSFSPGYIWSLGDVVRGKEGFFCFNIVEPLTFNFGFITFLMFIFCTVEAIIIYAKFFTFPLGAARRRQQWINAILRDVYVNDCWCHIANNRCFINRLTSASSAITDHVFKNSEIVYFTRANCSPPGILKMQMSAKLCILWH